MCGIVGAYNVPDVLTVILESFPMLRHRGQGTTGILLSNGERFIEPAPHLASGMVRSWPHALGEKVLLGTGHLRYPTNGEHTALENAQPIVSHGSVSLSIAHNGDTPEFEAMRTKLEHKGVKFLSSADTEVILQEIVHKTEREEDLRETMLEVFADLKSAYSLVMSTPQTLIGVRDPWGYRPLSLARLGEGWILASETCVFDALRAEYVRDIEPGELVWIDEKGLQSFKFGDADLQLQQCAFELIYFSRPDSKVFGRYVDGLRKALGARLAMEVSALSHPDIVFVPVPDSAMFAADGYARAAGVPLEHALLRSHYLSDPNEQRTFIGEEVRREDNVRMKFNPIRHRIEGKWVVLLEDSLVRGTTVRKIASMVRQNGATGVSVLVASPPLVHPCRTGIDMKTYKQLLAAQKQGRIEEICEFIGADELFYLSLEGFHQVLREEGSEKDFCLACFDGKYAL